MLPEIIDTIAPLLALLGVGTFGLLGMRMWLNAKTDRRRQVGADDLERLGEALDGLHDQIRSMREDLGELHERVDFAERLLARSGSAGPTRTDES